MISVSWHLFYGWLEMLNGYVVSGKSAKFSFIVSTGVGNALLVLDCIQSHASVTCSSQQGQDVCMKTSPASMHSCAAVLL